MLGGDWQKHYSSRHDGRGAAGSDGSPSSPPVIIYRRLAAFVRGDHGEMAALVCGQPRSPHWRTIEKAFREANPACAACFPSEFQPPVQVHHVLPYHYAKALGRPDLELDPRNLISLCETEANKSAANHHLLIGHLGDFQVGNLAVRDDAIVYRGRNEAYIRSNSRWQSEIKYGRIKAFNSMTADERRHLRQWMDVTYPVDELLCLKYRLVIVPYTE